MKSVEANLTREEKIIQQVTEDQSLVEPEAIKKILTDILQHMNSGLDFKSAKETVMDNLENNSQKSFYRILATRFNEMLHPSDANPNVAPNYSLTPAAIAESKRMEIFGDRYKSPSD